MTYDQWELQVPSDVKEDSVWKMRAYRLGLFLSDLAWHDAQKLAKSRLMLATAEQLYRAASNVSPNLCEGYSRQTGKDRARFYEYALGSVRECRDWYYKGRHALTAAVLRHRISVCTELTKLLLRMVPRERRANEPIARPK